MRTQSAEKKHERLLRKRTGLLVLCILTAMFVCLPMTGITAHAAERLTTPKPAKEGAFGVTWTRVSHAASYDVKLTLTNQDGGKTVTRTYSTTLNHLDLTLFAAECTVEVQVRAVPSYNTRSKYSTSNWGVCGDAITPAENNGFSGYADVSGDRFTISDENGTKFSGWQKINNAWFYFNPSDGCRTAVGWTGINGGTYYFEESGKMHVGWLEWEKNWYYLNPADSAEGKMVTGWFEVTPGRPFYFTENGTSDHPRGSLNEEITNANYPDSKPPYVINKDTGASGGSTVQPVQPSQPEQKSTGWQENPNGTWSYLVNGTAVKSAWKNVDGFWYYFDGSGIMQKGWQRIGGAWYYLEPNANGSNGYKCGAAWMNTTTPDGYQLNASGQWVRDGQVVTDGGSSGSGSSGSGSGGSSGSGSSLRQIGTVLISLNVTEPRGGRCRYAEVSGASDSVILSQSCSDAYSTWTPGTAVTFTVELKPRDGYSFTGSTRFRCNGAEVTGISGDSLKKTVRITYTTTAKLDAPTMFYITDNNELKWMPVPYAKRYKVTVTGGDGRENTTETVTSPCVELWNYGNIDNLTMTATVSALGTDGSKTTAESDKVTVGDLGNYKKTHKLNGTFELKEGILRFKDDSGTALTGWQNLCGYWFFFKTGGAAAGPGWYQDTTGYWYYFDSYHRMVTGNIAENGKNYFLNDGSRGDLPLGAWVQ